MSATTGWTDNVSAFFFDAGSIRRRARRETIYSRGCCVALGFVLVTGRKGLSVAFGMQRVASLRMHHSFLLFFIFFFSMMRVNVNGGKPFLERIIISRRNVARLGESQRIRILYVRDKLARVSVRPRALYLCCIRALRRRMDSAKRLDDIASFLFERIRRRARAGDKRRPSGHLITFYEL